MMTRCIELLARFYHRYGAILTLSFAASLPLSLTLSYYSLFPLLISWLAAHRDDLRAKLRESRDITLPLYFLFIAHALSAPFGVDPWRSWQGLPPALFYSLSIFPVADVVRARGPTTLLFALMMGQGIAALHTVLESAFSAHIPSLFLGPVTESGQLAIVCLLALGLGFSLRAPLASSSDNASSPHRSVPLGLALGSFTATVAWIGLGYVPGHPALTHDPTYTSLILTLVMVFLALLIPLLWAGVASTDRYFRLPAGSGQTRRIFLIFLPLLLAALVLNLKRGPWMGVCIGGALFLALYQSRLLVPIALLVVLGYLGLEPVRQRIAEIPEHFYITGGRSMLWDIGVDLSTRFPLGVGVRNSRFLQTFSDEIPEEMNHFHNNLINITVEGGWIALSLFLWWIVSLLRVSFIRSAPPEWNPLVSAIGCAVVSWQVAGLVEYNWGDSEVRMMVYITLGLLLGVRSTLFACSKKTDVKKDSATGACA